MWFSKTQEQVLAELKVEQHRGLSNEEVEKRLGVYENEAKSYKQKNLQTEWNEAWKTAEHRVEHKYPIVKEIPGLLDSIIKASIFDDADPLLVAETLIAHIESHYISNHNEMREKQVEASLHPAKKSFGKSTTPRADNPRSKGLTFKEKMGDFVENERRAEKF